MKKQLVSLFAMACMVFASSCSQEEVVSQSTGNEVAVTFTANLRNDVKSRAVGDDTDNVDQLVFAVYDKNGKELPELRQSTHVTDDNAKKAITLTDNGVMKEAKIEVVLVKGQTYSFAFWAQKKGHAAYSFDPETAKVEISYQNTNDKSADAFFASVTNHKVTGSFDENVTLKRPFAQINFLTTAQDLKDAAKSEFTPSQSQIVVKNAATELNVLDGTVSGNTEVTFGLANLVGHDLDDVNADERVKIKNGGKYVGFTNTGTFPLVETEGQAEPFIYLATAYFLPIVPTASTDIDASVLVKATGKDDYDLSVTKVKIQRNYRTNIYGNLLTSNGTFYVTVDPGFVDDYSYEEEDETTKVVGTIAEANALFAEGETNVTITEVPASASTLYLNKSAEDATVNFAFEEGSTPATITIAYAEGASDTEKPANIEVNGNAGDLVINAPNSTVALNGSYNSVTATTATNTLIVTKGSEITTLTLNAGNAEIYYGAVTTLTKAKGYTGTITWTVDSKEQLAQIATDVNAGKTFKGETIALISDIDLNNEEWTPIGNSTNNFQGIFDGQGHIISNLVVNMEGKSNVGLFGYTTDGEIKNLTVNNAKVTGRLYVGVVAGTPYASKYTDIKVTGHVEVNGMSYVGGVGGKNAYANWTDITVDVDASSYVKANSVENGTEYRTYVGGVVGFNGEGVHSFSNIKSNINVSGSTCDVGGLFGIAHYGNKFENCSSSGNVEITAATEAGDAEEIGGIAGVWHNGGDDVVFTGCSFTGTLKANVTEGVDLSDNTITGKAYSANGTGKLIIDGMYMVIADSFENLQSLENANVSFLGDINGEATTTAPYGNKVGVIQNGGVIDGKGYELEVEVSGDDYGIMTYGGTIKNLTMTTGCRAIMTMSPTQDVILDNVKIGGEGILYPLNTGENTSVEGLKLIATNSSFGGWTSFDGGFESATFTGCEFFKGSYYDEWPYGCLVKPYINTLFEECTFVDKYYLDLSSLKADCKVTFKNCKVNGVAVTADILGTKCDGTETFCVELPEGRTLSDCVEFK